MDRDKHRLSRKGCRRERKRARETNSANTGWWVQRGVSYRCERELVR